MQSYVRQPHENSTKVPAVAPTNEVNHGVSTGETEQGIPNTCQAVSVAMNSRPLSHNTQQWRHSLNQSQRAQEQARLATTLQKKSDPLTAFADNLMDEEDERNFLPAQRTAFPPDEETDSEDSKSLQLKPKKTHLAVSHADLPLNNAKQASTRLATGLVQRRKIHSEYHGDFESEDLTAEELLALLKQLLRVGGDQSTIADLKAALAAGENQEQWQVDTSQLDPWEGFDTEGAEQDSTLQTETQLASSLDQSMRIAAVIIRLPTLTVDAVQKDEADRQLKMQLAGLNQLTALEWLENLLLNRLKTTDQIIAKGFGTEQGKRLGMRIDRLLYQDQQLARLLMGKIIANMKTLLGTKGLDPKVTEFLISIINAADRSLATKDNNVYQQFRVLRGVDNLQMLSRIGLAGGSGRQHGTGDEQDFRKRHLQGIELLKSSSTLYERNACLHNPDQCAGGPMEILWQLAHQAQMQRAQQWYNDVLKAFNHAKYLLGSYQEVPPRTSDGELDQRKIDDAENSYLQLEDELEQAAANYMQTVSQHVGNRDVNSLLGSAWMEGIPGNQINRVDMILNRVLKLPFDQLGNVQLNVQMDVASSAASNLTPFSDVVFPDVTSGSAKPDKKIKPVKHRKTKGQKLEEQTAKRGGSQQTLIDLAFRNSWTATSSSSSSSPGMTSNTNTSGGGKTIGPGKPMGPTKSQAGPHSQPSASTVTAALPESIQIDQWSDVHHVVVGDDVGKVYLGNPGTKIKARNGGIYELVSATGSGQFLLKLKSPN